MENRNINRIRVVLAEQNRTNKWLAEKLGVGEVTVSRWVNNLQQPRVEVFVEIADLLKVDIRDLFEPTIRKK
ncbi:helix-turn-helix transcriptional regulator [Deminuibacter soli]|uniref:XRE family transcriptional regulator n=1 Tax=Deminuibacter soli TaxID=2291815 RepID=A0A3E1NMF2_9BACT|nr:helix-turn-helix transcriptional regulator [Deminuibacter soli]RFM29115.1 XRE family transcriptional regulator [Deminuibacter soli]